MASSAGPNHLRSNVRRLYKTLIYLGRQHPKGADYFLPKVKQEFMKNKDETDVEQIKKHIAYGRYMVRELESMYQMRKYRAMKQRYYDKQEDR